MPFTMNKYSVLLGGLIFSTLSFTVNAETQPLSADSQYQAASAQILHEQIKSRLSSASEVQDRYQLEKASAWLTYADHQYSERGFTPAGKEAFEQVSKLLQQEQKPSLTTAIISSSQVMRRDLWLRAEQLKLQPGFSCAYRSVAQAEVNLVWAAAEYCELGWRHSREIFAAAERQMDQAVYLAQQCEGASGQVQQPSVVKLPELKQLNGSIGCAGVNPELWPLKVSEDKAQEPAVLQIKNTVHFALDKSVLSPESKAVLDEIIQVIKEQPEWSVTLYGYTDARANAAYNLKLSERRIASVQQYLTAQGINPSRIASEARGKTDLIEHDDAVQSTAMSRRVEMLFTDAEGKEIKTETQYSDLQKEK
ncbi:MULTISPECIES: OmpA family protein [Acinetobacter]|uniref:OmpA family protein n=1 Tax=Acinetobacter TaxID=469 RepID=UPI000B3D1E64|nr:MULTISPECIES: OmpA family protein [Acinetobacter]AXY60691.1 OmpA family protein [Acinetobacter sp. WCHAc010052]WOE40635.1 OmpA family protein [Acinetobacter chinensis]